MRLGIDLRPLSAPYKTGIGEYTFSLMNAILSKPGEHFFYLFTTRPSTVPWAEGDNVRIITSPIYSRRLNIQTLLFSRPRLDNIICRAAKIPKLDGFFSPQLNYTTLAPSTPHFVTVHDVSFAFFPEMLTPKQRLWHKFLKPREQCERAAHIFTPSENTRRDLISVYHLPPEKISVLYPGLPTTLNPTPADIVQKKYNLPKNYILFLGTLEPRKNILALIQAFATAYSKLQTPNLVIVGAPGWKNKETYNAITASPLKEKICCIPFVDDNDKPALYQNAAVFVYPSFYEGFGFPILEAMNTSVPIITSPRSSLPEIAGNAAYYADPLRPDELAAGIVRLMSDTNLREEKIKNGRERVAEFSWDVMAREWLEQVSKVRNK